MIPAAPDALLPDGFVVRLSPTVRRRPDGALLGGSPLRLMRLSARARELLVGDRVVVRDATSAALAARLIDAGLAVPELAPRPAADVTVVIPVRDRPEGLTRLLGALRDDPATATNPVVIVDDGSVVPVSAPGATVLRHEVSRGPAAARNTGLGAATTPFVVFLDSDCVPEAPWLERLRPHLDDPVVAAVAPRIVALAGADRRWLSDYESAVSALDMGAEPASVRPLSAVSYLPSAALLARRAALGDGFDETMQVAEDVDLIWRLAHAGWRVRYDPAAQVAHDHPTRTAD
jgi:mycofactocin glycosyltransferase